MAKMKNLDIELRNIDGFDSYREMVNRVLEGESSGFSTDWIETVSQWHQEMIESRKYFELMLTNYFNTAN